MPEVVIAHIFRQNGYSGVHTHIRELRKYLDENDINSTVLTPFSWGRRLKYPVFGFRRLIMRVSAGVGVLWFQYSHVLFLRMALRRHLTRAADCVIYAQGPLEADAALRARYGPHQRVVMAVHFSVSNADEPALTGEIKRDGIVFRMIRRANRRVILRVDRMVCVSHWARNAILSWLPEAAGVTYTVIGNFIPPAGQDPNREPIGDLVTTGRLDPEKNHGFLLEVLAETRRDGRLLTLDLLGDGPCRPELERQAHALGIADQVRFRGFRDDVRDLLPRYRAYVHSSKQDNCPLAIMEAMAAGLPIVAGEIGGISELCDDGVEARFWPMDDAATAAATLTRLLDSEPDLLKAAQAAADRFQRDYVTHAVAPHLVEFLLGP